MYYLIPQAFITTNQQRRLNIFRLCIPFRLIQNLLKQCLSSKTCSLDGPE